jgi:hypothetical protein
MSDALSQGVAARFAKRLVMGAACRWAIAWVTLVLVSYAHFAAGGYTREALFELLPGAIWLTGPGGALAAAALAAVAGQVVLPPVVRPVALGVLAGVGPVAAVTLAVASCFGWPWHKGPQGQVMYWGLAFGVPCGVLALFVPRRIAASVTIPTAPFQRVTMNSDSWRGGNVG